MPRAELKAFLKLLAENKVDRDKIDLMALDSRITTREELKEAVLEEYPELHLVNVKEEAQKIKNEEEHLKAEAEERAREEERKVIDEFKNALPAREVTINSFERPKHYVRMVVRGISNGAVLIGPGGFGKSYAVMSEVRKELKPDEWVYVNSYVTPLRLYQLLHDNNGKLIIFDDVKGLLDSEKSISIVKGALWELDNDRRVISYETTSKANAEYPKQTEFNGRIIILANKIKLKDADIEAMRSRCHYCHLRLEIKEVLTIMKQIIKMPYKDLTLEERGQAYKLLEAKILESPTVMSFNLRMLIKAYQYIKYMKLTGDKCLGKELTEAMIDTEKDIDENAELGYIYRLMKDNYSAGEQVAKFVQRFNSSRNTYYRRKKELMKMLGEKEE